MNIYTICMKILTHSKEDRIMTQSTYRATGKIIIWSIVLAAFMALFFSGSGSAGFAHDKERIVAVAILLAAGYGAFFLMMGLSRKKKGGGLNRDERDERIEGRAAGITLTIVLVYVYFLGIALWALFQDDGSVPAGWLWFLAYSTVLIGMVSHGLFTLLLASGKVGHGEG
jgi:uncharacterized membrane protein YozB (DUF420 family)